MSRRKTRSADESTPMVSPDSDSATTLVDESLPNGEAVPPGAHVSANAPYLGGLPPKKKGKYASYLLTGRSKVTQQEEVLADCANRFRWQKWWAMSARLVLANYTDLRVVKCVDKTDVEIGGDVHRVS